jgi:hypothetical protein
MALKEPLRHGDKQLLFSGWEVVIERRLLDAKLVGNIP